MQKNIYKDQIVEYKDKINFRIIDFSKDGQTEMVESFQDFTVIGLQVYDISNIFREPHKIMIYLDKEDLFYISDTPEGYKIIEKYFQTEETNEHALYMFFDNMLKGSTSHLADVEDRISKVDANIINEIGKNTRSKIMSLRYEILRLKKYYEQFDFIFEELNVNDNELLTKSGLRYFRVLRNRAHRLSSMIINLKEYIMQVRESYQAQMDIEQNKLMKFFTIITSIFAPLTLLVGWYGMNLKMPEFTWKYGYIFVMLLAGIICTLWYVVFKKKKWF